MIRRIGLASSWVLGGSILLVLAIFAGAQTGPGKRLLELGAGRLLTTAETEVELAGLRGLVPFDMTLARLRVRDRDGVWLDAAELRFAWAPRALLDGRIAITEASAGRVDLARLPRGDGGDEPIALPELPRALPLVEIDHLEVAELAVGVAVLGEAASFRITGRAAAVDEGRSVALDLAAERIDRATARAALTARVDLDPPALDIQARVEETGGLLAALTDRPEAGALEVELAGDGPLADWSGSLAIQAEGLATVAATLELALTERPELRLQASLVPGDHLLSDELAPLLGEQLILGLRAALTDDRTLALHDLDAEAAIGRLTGSAELNLDSSALDGELSLALPDLGPLAPLTGLPLAGDVGATATLGGALDRPTSRWSLHGQGLRIDEFDLDRLDATVEIATDGRLGVDDLVLRVAGDGRLQGAGLPGVPLPLDQLAWRLRGSVPAVGPVVVEELRATASPLDVSVSGSGRLDPDSLEGRAEIGVEMADLGALSAPFGQRVDGRATADLALTSSAGAERVVVDLDGAVAALSGLPEAAAALLGPTPELGARLVMQAGERVEVSDLVVTGAAAGLDGQLGMTLAEGRLDGRLRLEVPRLEVLAEALDQDLAGTLQLVAELGGTRDRPEIDLEAHGETLTLAGWPVDELALAATVGDPLAAPRGRVQLATTTRGVELGLDAAYRLADEQLDLTEIGVVVPRGRIDGQVSVDLSGPAVDGELGGRIDDLVGLGPLLPVTLRGRVTGRARFEGTDGGQGMALAVEGSGLRGPFGRVGGLRLTANGRDLLGRPVLDATVALDDFRQDAIRLERAELQATGGFDGLDLRASLAGEAIEPIVLAASGRLTLVDGVQLRLDGLEGDAAGLPVRLERPAELSMRDDRVGVDGLALRLGEGRLRADGRLQPAEVEARLALDRLPLASLEPFGLPTLEGSLRAELSIAGRPDDPTGTMAIEVDGLRPPGARFRDLPSARVDLRADLAGRRLALNLRGQGVTAEPVVVEAALPLMVDLNRFAVDLPAEGAVSGRLDAQVELARLADALALDDQRLVGLLTVRLGLAGTVAAPLVTGPIALRDGRWELGATGTVLDRITLDARAKGREITIEQLSATDGGAGRVSGRGRVLVDPAADFPIDLTIELSRARLIQDDVLSATLSGDLALTGDVDGTRLSGTITVDRADASLPELGGPDIEVIEVQTVGLDGTTASGGGGQAGGQAPLVLDLTIAMPGQVFVIGRGLTSEWQGRLKVTGPVDAPRLNGTLTVRRGEFLLLDRRLELRKGEILFTGARPPVPELEIEAFVQTADITAVIRLSGTLDDLHLELESEPSLPEDEILAYLLFGQSSDQLTAAQAVQLAAAVHRLTSGEAGLLERFRAGIGLDLLDVGVGATPEDRKVRAGKRVGDRIYLEVEQGEAQRSGRAKVEVDILPGVSIEADTGEDERTGVGVRWRYDY